MAAELFKSVIARKTKTTRQRYTVPLSILAHALILGVLVVVPLIATGAWPLPTTSMRFVPVAHMPPAPPPPVVHRALPAPTAVAELNPNLAPMVAPEGIVEEPPPSMPGVVMGIRDVLPTSAADTSRLTAAPPPAEAEPSGPLRVGGKIKEPRRIQGVPPIYPVIARAARAEAVVELEAIVARDGTVRDVVVRRGHSMLNQAAIDAVRQWRYSPPMLNGEPIEVVMTVLVEFKLR